MPRLDCGGYPYGVITPVRYRSWNEIHGPIGSCWVHRIFQKIGIYIHMQNVLCYQHTSKVLSNEWTSKSWLIHIPVRVWAYVVYVDCVKRSICIRCVFVNVNRVLITLIFWQQAQVLIKSLTWASMSSHSSSKKKLMLWSYRVYRAYGPYRTLSRSTRSFRLQYIYSPTTTS